MSDYRNKIMYLCSLYNTDTPEKADIYSKEERYAMEIELYQSIGDKIETLVFMEYGQTQTIDKIIAGVNKGLF